MTQHRGRRRPTGGLRRLGRETVLTVGAVLGVICLVAAVVAMAFDVRPVIFRSGSMSPAIETGALAFSRTVPASELAVGDVVTVEDSSGALVTHRIRSLTLTGGNATLILKGDDNPVADPEPYVVQSVDRVFLDVPRLGYVASVLSGPIGIFGGGLLVGLVLTTAFGRGRRDDDDQPPMRPVAPDAEVTVRPSRASQDGRRKLALAATVVVGAVGAVGTTSTSAAWVDDSQVRTGSFTMRNAPLLAPGPPTVTACVRSGNSLTLTFNRVFGATSYRVSYSSPAGSETVPAGLGVGSITYQTVNANFNNTSGTIRVFAVNALGTSTSSNVYAYSANGGGICVPA